MLDISFLTKTSKTNYQTTTIKISR